MKLKERMKGAALGVWGWIVDVSKLIYYFDADSEKGMPYWQDPTSMGLLVGIVAAEASRILGLPVSSSVQLSIVGSIVGISQIISRYRGIKAATFSEGTPLKIIEGFNLTRYATNPKEFGTVKMILERTKLLTGADQINQYILKRESHSPLTAQMFLDAVDKYQLGPGGLALMLAIVQDESMFGTLGRGARTFNPGNVGNFDDGRNTNYGSWPAGVEAIAEWLYNHRVG